MDEATVKVTGVLLVGSEAVVVPVLAIIGAATVMGLAGYGGMKLAASTYDSLKEKVSRKRA